MGLYDRDYGRDDGETSWQETVRPRSATISIIVVTVIFFFVDWALARGELGDSLAISPDTLRKPWMWWKFITYGLVHGDQLHVLFNMFGLYIFGREVERRLGFGEFIRFYIAAVFVSGFVGTLVYELMNQPAMILGASGGVVAVTILFAFFYPHVELLFMFVLPMKAWVLCTLFVALDLMGALRGEGGTAFAVHLAGAAFAALYFLRGWSLAWASGHALTDWRQRMSQRSRRMKLKLHDPDRKIQQEADQADQILAKIHEHGEASLSSAERKILERYSRRQREKRGDGV